MSFSNSKLKPLCKCLVVLLSDTMFCTFFCSVLIVLLICFQVTNAPWGERVSFVFDPHSDLVAKALHVCPFMVANYAFFFTAFRGQEIMVHKNYYLFYFIVFYPD